VGCFHLSWYLFLVPFEITDLLTPDSPSPSISYMPPMPLNSVSPGHCHTYNRRSHQSIGSVSEPWSYAGHFQAIGYRRKILCARYMSPPAGHSGWKRVVL
jgi:hypothetical protein